MIYFEFIIKVLEKTIQIIYQPPFQIFFNT